MGLPSINAEGHARLYWWLRVMDESQLIPEKRLSSSNEYGCSFSLPSTSDLSDTAYEDYESRILLVMREHENRSV